MTGKNCDHFLCELKSPKQVKELKCKPQLFHLKSQRLMKILTNKSTYFHPSEYHLSTKNISTYFDV